MWKLENTKKEHIEQYFVVGEEIVVGRKDAALMITNDPSVNRKHAVLVVKHLEANLGDPTKPSSLFMRDEGSKYGTFKNGVRITSEVVLSDCDIVKFGQMESEYRVRKIPLVITTSCLDVSRKRELKRTVYNLGGHFISEWQPCCSHLVMPEVKVTIKALCCLLSVKPIVKPEYFSDLKNSVKTSSFLQPNQYVPPIGEALIDKERASFNLDIRRKNLFKGKSFLFLDEKQYKKLHLGIVLGGGTASILSAKELTSDLLLQKGVCVIEPIKESSQERDITFQEILSILQPKKLRMIPESDVGLAVAYCSTEKFCNPEFNMGDVVLQNQKLDSQTLTEREVYVPDTQERLTSAERNKMSASVVGNSLHFSTFQADPVEDMEISEIPLSAQVKRELDDIFDEPEDIKADSFPKISAKPSIVDSMDVTRKLKRELPSRNHSVSTMEAGPSIADSMEVTRKLKRESTSKSSNGEFSFIDQNDEFSTKRKRPSLVETNLSSSKQNGLSKAEDISRPKVIKSESHYLEEDVENIATLRNERKHIKSENNDQSDINGCMETELPRNLMKVEIVSLICKKKNIVPEVHQYKNSSVKNFKKFKKVLPKKTRVLPKIIGAHELIAYDRIAAQICNDEWDDPTEEVPQPVRGAFDWDTPTV